MDAAQPEEILRCAVCATTCDGYHYGVPCCPGCKAFFRRSVRKNLSYRCDRGQKCVISGKQRSVCRYCRLLRCFQVGMNEKALQVDRGKINRKNAKHRVAAQAAAAAVANPGGMFGQPPAKASAGPGTPGSSDQSSTAGSPSASQVGKLEAEYGCELGSLAVDMDTAEAIRLLQPLATMPLDDLFLLVRSNYAVIMNYFLQRHEQLKRSSIRKLCSGQDQNAQRRGFFETADMHVMIRQMTAHLTTTVEVLKRCPCFGKLTHEGRMALMRSYAPQGILLSNIMSTVPVVGEFVVLLDGVHVLPRNSTSFTVINRVVDEILDDLVPRFRILDLDEREFTCLRALAMWNPDLVIEPDSKNRVYRVQQTILLVLEKHIENRNKEKEADACRYGNLLMLLKSLQSTGERMRQCVQLARHLNLVDLDSFVENLFKDPKPLPTSKSTPAFATSGEDEKEPSLVNMRPEPTSAMLPVAPAATTVPKVEPPNGSAEAGGSTFGMMHGSPMETPSGSSPGGLSPYPGVGPMHPWGQGPPPPWAGMGQQAWPPGSPQSHWMAAQAHWAAAQMQLANAQAQGFTPQVPAAASGPANYDSLMELRMNYLNYCNL